MFYIIVFITALLVFLWQKRSPLSIFLTSEMPLKLLHQLREILILFIRKWDGDIFQVYVNYKSRFVFASQRNGRAVTLEFYLSTQWMQNVFMLLDREVSTGTWFKCKHDFWRWNIWVCISNLFVGILIANGSILIAICIFLCSKSCSDIKVRKLWPRKVEVESEKIYITGKS